MQYKDWYKLICKSTELQLKGTLNGGQSFRWKKINTETDEEWIGVFSNLVWILKQNDDHILYQVYEATTNKNSKNKNIEKYENLLRNYFRLDIDLEKHYTQWSAADENFKLASKEFYGIRMLAQDPVENLFSFICSTNNNITRITSMVEKLAKFYGEKICTLNGVEYFSFPNVEKLAGSDVETKLRKEGFGYRAGYIAKSAKMIVETGGEKWFEKLNALNYQDAKIELMKLTGIGAKVADCICLMSLNHLEAIPVDTHVYQITARNYMPQLSKKKTVTDKIYNEIGDYFRNLYGPFAGWAQTVLFCADLKIFQNNEENIPVKKRKK